MTGFIRVRSGERGPVIAHLLMEDAKITLSSNRYEFNLGMTITCLCSYAHARGLHLWCFRVLQTLKEGEEYQIQ